jgi:hypothetical protein
MHQMKDGTYLAGHVRRGQWSVHKREQIFKQTAEVDGKDPSHPRCNPINKAQQARKSRAPIFSLG